MFKRPETVFIAFLPTIGSPTRYLEVFTYWTLREREAARKKLPGYTPIANENVKHLCRVGDLQQRH